MGQNAAIFGCMFRASRCPPRNTVCDLRAGANIRSRYFAGARGNIYGRKRAPARNIFRVRATLNIPHGPDIRRFPGGSPTGADPTIVRMCLIWLDAFRCAVGDSEGWKQAGCPSRLSRRWFSRVFGFNLEIVDAGAENTRAPYRVSAVAGISRRVRERDRRSPFFVRTRPLASNCVWPLGAPILLGMSVYGCVSRRYGGANRAQLGTWRKVFFATPKSARLGGAVR